VKVIVVGGGLAGVACGRALSQAGVEVEILDRGQALGGRMATRETAGHVVDIGASYITAEGRDFGRVIEDWVARGLAMWWTDTFHVSDGTDVVGTSSGPLRLAGRRGLRALVEDLAGGLPARHPVTVQRVESTADGRRQTVITTTGERLAADAVVLAMPQPQAARIVTGATAQALGLDRGPTWEPVICVAGRWARRWWPSMDGVFVNDDRSAATVSWIADDGRRRGDGDPVLVVHSTSLIAERCMHDPQAAVSPVLSAAAEALGVRGPVPEPLWTHAQRWRLARPRPAEHVGPAPLTPILRSGIGVCGDGWTDRPRAEAAWSSGTELAAALVRAVTGQRLH
jgi:hypothetical protein